MEKKNKEEQLMIVNYEGGHDGAWTSRYPPGYHFMPTDRELISEYLAKKVNNEPIPVEEISEVDLYEHPPEYLAERYPPLGKKSWYFFTPRTRKYPNGKRPSRSVKDKGHWRATGSDKKIVSADGTVIGFSMTLTYFEGKASDRTKKKTKWIMNEYKLNIPSKRPNSTSMRLDNWVLCRIHGGSNDSNRKNTDADEVNVDAKDEVGEDEDIAQLAGNNKAVEGSENHVGPQSDNNYNYQINHLGPCVHTNNYAATTRENHVDHGWLMNCEYPYHPYTASDYSGQGLLPDMTRFDCQNHDYDGGIVPLPDIMGDSILSDIDFAELDNFLRDHEQWPAAAAAPAPANQGDSSSIVKDKIEDSTDDQHMGSKRRGK